MTKRKTEPFYVPPEYLRGWEPLRQLSGRLVWRCLYCDRESDEPDGSQHRSHCPMRFWAAIDEGRIRINP